MKVVKNAKELEKMILEELKKKIPSMTEEYCNEWYKRYPEMEDVILESDFVQSVKDSMKVSVSNGKFTTEFGLLNVQIGDEEKRRLLTELWEKFKQDYRRDILPKIFKK